MYKLMLAVLLAAFALDAVAQPSPEDILRRIDENMTVSTGWSRAQMTIQYRQDDERTLEFESWSHGVDRSYLEFTAPARDAGSRFLRLDDRMWIFLPRVGKSVRIQGHMLRQGLMGSDFSYGDASERPSMVDDYEAVIEGNETLDGRPTFVLHLTARKSDLAYPMRRMWVDAERWVPLKEERFAHSGKLLKTSRLGDIRRLGGGWYPFRIELDNALQSDTRTTLQILDFKVDVDVPAHIFTVRYLEGAR